MNPVLTLITIGIIVWLLNFIFGMIQIKNFNKNYMEMRRMGRVAIGRRKGHFQAGTIVMILIDNEGKIIMSRMMQGVTVFAKVKEFKGIEGKILGEMDKSDLISYNKLTRLAILDAIKNYNAFKGGEIIENTVTT